MAYLAAEMVLSAVRSQNFRSSRSLASVHYEVLPHVDGRALGWAGKGWPSSMGWVRLPTFRSF